MQGMIDLARPRAFFPKGSRVSLRAPRWRAGNQRLQLLLQGRLRPLPADHHICPLDAFALNMIANGPSKRFD